MKSTTVREHKISSRLWSWLFELDRILRGELSCKQQIHDGSKEADIRFPVGGISVLLGAMGAVYGICMGVFAIINGFETTDFSRAYFQFFATIIKVPLLFVLTIAVTFPSLYVFNTLVGSRMRLPAVFRLLVASLAINLSVLASLGPVVAFFSASSPNYPFIVLLNVTAFSISGAIGVGFLNQTLRGARSHEAINSPVVDAEVIAEHAAMPAGPQRAPSTRLNSNQDLNRRNVDWVFSCWMVAFGLVGAQMGWVLRPFVGAPGKPFEFFRDRESNFFAAVVDAFFKLF